MIGLMTPICSTKMYSFDELVRGVLRQNIDLKEVHWVFVIQENALIPSTLDRIQHLIQAVSSRFGSINWVSYRLPYHDALFDPRADVLTWKHRAQFAADLRAVGIDWLRSSFSDMETMVSLGCDVCFQKEDDLSRLLAPNEDGLLPDLLSGVIVARLRRFPLVLSYDRKTRLWAVWESYPRDRRFIADWTGMDVLVLRKNVFSSVSFWDYKVTDYDLGEDGWFCMKAKDALGVDTWVDPFVAPYHIHESGMALWSEGVVPQTGILCRCPHCGLEAKFLKSWSSLEEPCHRCRVPRYLDPWWEPQEFCEVPVRVRGGV